MSMMTIAVIYSACTAATWVGISSYSEYEIQMGLSTQREQDTSGMKVIGGILWPIVWIYVSCSVFGKLAILPGIFMAKRARRLQAEAVEHKRLAKLPVEKLIREAEEKETN